MGFNKRGTELSMNVIIIAAIAILVLVILAMFVFNAAGKTTTGTSCEGLGGECMAKCVGEYPLRSLGNSADCGTGRNCCLPVGSDRR